MSELRHELRLGHCRGTREIAGESILSTLEFLPLLCGGRGRYQNDEGGGERSQAHNDISVYRTVWVPPIHYHRSPLSSIAHAPSPRVTTPERRRRAVSRRHFAHLRSDANAARAWHAPCV